MPPSGTISTSWPIDAWCSESIPMNIDIFPFEKTKISLFPSPLDDTPDADLSLPFFISDQWQKVLKILHRVLMIH